jgi:hypothetical protein
MNYDINERYKTVTECIKTIDCKECEHREECRQWISDNYSSIKKMQSHEEQ